MKTERLLPSLLVELHQAEHATCRHAMREADRLGPIPPAAALRVVATHASGALDHLPGLAEERGVPLTTFSSVVGDAFSYLREVAADHLADLESSYRATILDCRRGIDLVHLLRTAAANEHDLALVAFCDHWLPTRTRLVREAADELEWFGKNPTFARRHIIPILGAPPLGLVTR